MSLCALQQSQCMHPDQCVSVNRWKYVSQLMSNIRALLILFQQTPKPTHFLPWFLFSFNIYLWIAFNLQRWDDHLPFKHIAKTAVTMVGFCQSVTLLKKTCTKWQQSHQLMRGLIMYITLCFLVGSQQQHCAKILESNCFY